MSETTAKQLLPIEAYRSPDWFEREQREIFARSWTFAGTEQDLEEPGSFMTVPCGPSRLIVLRDGDGELRAFHNLCRHRGTELLEGCGKLGKTIVCPYHKWTYSLTGELMGMPQQRACFPDIEKAKLGLHRASVATLKGLIFVHPEAEPATSFDDWTGDLKGALWPHELDALSYSGALIYEMKCNWKVFYENAVDGYHLAYLHEETLGGPSPLENVWERRGRHLLWYSTELEGRKTSLPEASAQALASSGASKIKGTESSDYAGISMLYPSTVVSANPYEFSIGRLEPVSPGLTRMFYRGWGKREGWLFGGGSSRKDQPSQVEVARLEDLKTHPLESGDFMMEDIFICERIQRAMASPRFSVGPLAQGTGCETPLTWFQRMIIEDLGAAA